MNRIVIVGATSGLGLELARRYAAKGWKVGACGRHTSPLAELASEFPGQVVAAPLDVNSPNGPELLRDLVENLGGMDVYLHVAGIGYDNPEAEPEREARIVETDCVGFARMTYAAYGMLGDGGRLAAVTSVAGTKGIAFMEAYSASKKFDQAYLQALRQRAHEQRRKISIIDLRPGWTQTALLKPGEKYPMMMQAGKVVEAMMRAIEKRRAVATIDRRWQLLCRAWNLVPDFIWRRMSTKKFR